MPDLTSKTMPATPDALISDKVFLITGGAGFIGSHIADALIAHGGKVVIVDNLITGRRENLNPAAVFYEENIANPEMIDKIFRDHKPDYVYHLAHFVLVPKSIDNQHLDTAAQCIPRRI
jgi:UDP-glucose 4-epimerase